MNQIQSVIKVSRGFQDSEKHVASTIRPNYTLDYYGSDLVDHNGPARIELLCPQCSSYHEFTTLSVVVVTHDLDEAMGTDRDFFSTASCSNCNAVVQVRCFDYDFDPDYWFDYVTHSPKKDVNLNKLRMPEPIEALVFEAIDLHERAQNKASLVICAELIRQVLKDQNAVPDDMMNGLLSLSVSVPLNVLEQFTSRLTSGINKDDVSAMLIEEILIICGFILDSLYS
ncbi:hypothetical protein [Paenibacillus marinisediminis]